MSRLRDLCLWRRLLPLIITTHLLLYACAGPESGKGSGVGDGEFEATLFSTNDPKILLFEWEAPPATAVNHYRIEHDPDDGSDFSVVLGADRITDNTYRLSIPVHRPDWLFGNYRIAAVDSQNNEVAVSNQMTLSNASVMQQLIGYVKAGNGDVNDRFGESIAVSADGSTLAVGAPYERSAALDIDGDSSDNSAAEAGAVYIFSRNGDGAWQQTAYVKAGNTDPGDQFGHAVALSADGGTLAVSAPGEDSSAVRINTLPNDNNAVNAGAAYIFEQLDSGFWTESDYLKADNTDSYDAFGSSLSLSADGSILAVGAQGEDSAVGLSGPLPLDNSAPSAGAVYLFVRPESGLWYQKAFLKADNADGGDQFGRSVSLDAAGATLAVGADLERSGADGINGDDTDNNAANAGAAYIFGLSSNDTWYQQAYLKADDSDPDDRFGETIALAADGNTLIVGAPQEDSAFKGVFTDPSDNSAQDSGAAYIFTRDSDEVWWQDAFIKAPNSDSADRFGSALAPSADGRLIAVGAPQEDSAAVGINGKDMDNQAPNSGAVYTFSRDSEETWTLEAYIKARNTDGEDLFGFNVALSTEGRSLAVGAPGEAGAAMGINPIKSDNSAPYSGAVYLY